MSIEVLTILMFLVLMASIALGHPLGASGTRLTTTLLHELERHDPLPLLVVDRGVCSVSPPIRA